LKSSRERRAIAALARVSAGDTFVVIDYPRNIAIAMIATPRTIL